MRKFFIILILLLTSGCWNYQELNEYAIVTGMAVDIEDNKYKISFLIANGNKSENEQTKTSIITGHGDSIYDAIKDISLMSPKELYISHLSVVIISEELAQKGISNLIDFLLREPQSHQNFYLLITKDDNPDDVLSILSPLAEYPSQNITSNVSTSEELQAKVSDANFNLFISKFFETGFEPIMNSIIVVGNSDLGEKPDSLDKPKQDAYTKLDTISLFKGDKLVAWSNKEESIGINMVLGEITNLYFTINYKDGYFVTNSNDYKVKYDLTKDKIIINANAKGDIIEINCNIDIEDDKVIKDLEKKVEMKMKEHIESAIKLAKKYQTDIFGFGNMYYKKYPKEYNKIKSWNEEFTNIEIEVITDFKYTSKGTLEQSTINYES